MVLFNWIYFGIVLCFFFFFLFFTLFPVDLSRVVLIVVRIIFFILLFFLDFISGRRNRFPVDRADIRVRCS